MNKPTPKITVQPIGPHTTGALINRGNIAIWFDPKTQWYAQPKANMVEIKLIPIQPSNAA